MAGDSEQIGADEIEKLLAQQQQTKQSEAAPSAVRYCAFKRVGSRL